MSRSLDDVTPREWTESARRMADEYAKKSGFPPLTDNVNRPAHYTQGSVECIDAIKAALTPDEFAGFCKGNALKYIWRERHKGGAESLAKAGWYLDKLKP